jgi:hypothetical protein
MWLGICGGAFNLRAILGANERYRICSSNYGLYARSQKVKTINVDWNGIPNNFTGIAIYPSGNKYWYVKGKRHRLDGPAIEYSDGSKYWYVEGKKLTFEQFWEKQKNTEYAPKIMADMLGATSKP